MGISSSAVQPGVGEDHITDQVDNGFSGSGKMLRDPDAGVSDAAETLSGFVRGIYGAVDTGAQCGR